MHTILIRRVIVVGVALALPGCHPTHPAAIPPTSHAEAAVERGTFILIVRGDTTVEDSYTRTATVLEGVVRPRVPGARFGWARYRVEFSARGDARLAHLALGRVGTGPGDPPSATLTTRVDSGAIHEEWPARPPTRTLAPAGTIPVFAPSIAMFQEVLRQARRRAAEGNRVSVPVYSLLATSQVEDADVHWTARDTAEVRWGGSSASYALDPDGRVLWARTADGQFTTLRLR